MKQVLLLFSALLFLGLSSTDLNAQKGKKQNGQKEKVLVATSKGKILPEMQPKLLAAFNKSFGSYYNASAVQLSPGRRGMRLTFTVHDKNVAFVSIDCLKIDGEGYVINGVGVDSATNCMKGTDCTQCKIPCDCGRNGGGGSCFEQENDGSGKLVDDFMQTLMP